LAAVGPLIVVSLAATACGSARTAPKVPAARILNTAKIELAITRSSLAQRGKHVRVACPDRVRQAKGIVFYCTAYYHRSTTPFAVTELNASGDVHYIAR
jgi:hypothetical protein